jgi:intracellular sulfur oxidation DsrE/DsrF family protein
MEENNFNKSTPRRSFLGMLATGATAVGLASLVTPLQLNGQAKKMTAAAKATSASPGDVWFNKVKGRHRVVYDATRPHEIFPFAWPKVFLMTNAATGSPASDCGVVVVLRHDAIPYAFQDNMWAKYNFAEVFKATDHGHGFQAPDAATAAKTRNPFWNTQPGDFKAPGLGAIDIGIKSLQKDGVMFCVCSAAMTVYSAAIADMMKMKADDVMKDWKANIIPGIQIVPSGVWALGRAQEHKCAYIFAG